MGKYMPRSLNLDEIDKFLEIYNPPKLSLEEAESLKRPQVSGKGENGGKKGEGQVKEHKQRIRGHGPWGGITVGVRDAGTRVRKGGKGKTTTTEQHYIKN